MIAKIYFDIARLRFDVPKGHTVSASVNNGLFFISNENDKRKKYCFGTLLSEYGNSIGRHAEGSAFGYADVKLSQSGIVSPQAFRDEYLKEFTLRNEHLQSILHFLWFIKDNSVGLYGTYGEIPEMKTVNGKSQSIVNYNCKGEVEDASFSQNDFSEASSLVMKYQLLSGAKFNLKDSTHILYEYDTDGNAKGIIPAVNPAFKYTEQTALDRAIHFLVLARRTSYLFYRIAYYMPVFECLFSTKGAEITYRMAMRAAFYIGEDANERNKIFDLISTAYNIRSRFIHGQEIEEKEIRQDNLVSLSSEIDRYLRMILKKVIVEDSNIFTKYSSKQRDDYFDNLVLGLPYDHSKAIQSIETAEMQRQLALNKAEEKRLKGEAQNKNR